MPRLIVRMLRKLSLRAAPGLARPGAPEQTARATPGLVWVLGGLALVFSIAAAALPPEHEVRRLIMAADTAVEESRWQDASRYLAHLKSLNAVKPADYHFLRGRVTYQAGQLDEAHAALETYIIEAGAEGAHYEQALALVTQVDEARRARPDAAEGEPIAIIEPAQRIDIDGLKMLYLENSAQGALLAHLNSLLNLNAWQPGRIVHSQPDQSIRYELDAGGDGQLQVREIAQDEQGQPLVTSQSLSVYGINPAVSHACFDADNSCWLYDPRDQSRWLRLANRPDKVEEIARVMSELIRYLQDPGGA